MRVWEFIDEAPIPSDEGTMYLLYRGGEYMLSVGDCELMTNRLHGSEDALADLAFDQLGEIEGARILVGGLGMGFTLAAALRRVGPTGQVTVAELVPAVVRWNREHFGKAAGYPLEDPRTEVFTGDVAELVEHPPAPWHAILLDVDNGPRWATARGNGWLYSRAGLRTAFSALVPGGVLAVWSSSANRAFTRRLRRLGFTVSVVRFFERDRPTHDGSGVHVVWVATRPPESAPVA